jgi:hypothetical protein
VESSCNACALCAGHPTASRRIIYGRLEPKIYSNDPLHANAPALGEALSPGSRAGSTCQMPSVLLRGVRHGALVVAATLSSQLRGLVRVIAAGESAADTCVSEA